MDWKKSIKEKYFLIFFIFASIVLLISIIHSPTIYKFIWGVGYLFADHTAIVSWLKCHHLNFDVYSNDIENCPAFITIFNYGHIFLSIPFNDFLEIFYKNYLPYIALILFVFLVSITINPKSIIEYLILTLAIFNPSSIFLVERMSFDLFVFLASIFVTFNRFYLLNWFLIYFLFFVKTYPIILGVNIFLENKNRKLIKIFLIIATMVLISAFYLLLHLNEYLITLSHHSAGKAGYHYLFSLNTFPKIFQNIFGFNYIFLILIFYSLFIYLTKFFYEKFRITYINLSKDLYSHKLRLFLLGGFISLICFVIFSNYFYREVFLIMTIPYLLNFFKLYKNSMSKNILYLIIFRYLFLYIYAYFNVNDGIYYIDNVRNFSDYFLIIISIKGFLDFILLSLISSLLFLNTRKILMNLAK